MDPEAEKACETTQKENERRALEQAKVQGKGAVAAAKARQAQERAVAAEAKKLELLRITAEKKAEKARIAADNKTQQSEIRAAKRKATSQTIPGLPEGEQRILPPPQHPVAMPEDNGLSKSDTTQDKFSLDPDDPANFLKLCSALRILIRHRLNDSEIDQAEDLIRAYCTELIRLYGSGAIKPNHHYATHVAECVRDFGPLHDFWTFLFECLNKVLKSFKTNNHGQGDLETTFFNEFHKASHTSRLICTLSRHPKDSLPAEVAGILLKASKEERGTVAGLAALMDGLDDEHINGRTLFSPSPRSETAFLSLETYRLLVDTICHRFPLTPVHSRWEQPANPSIGSNRSSLVHVCIPAMPPIDLYGEILEIFQVTQDFRHIGCSMWTARARWFKPWTEEIQSIWNDFKLVDVRLWEIAEYQQNNNLHFPALFDPHWIQGQIALTTVAVGRERTKVWATIDLKKLVQSKRC
ncbi:hypothetical protein BC826DRAFT_974159 [Russula brevipes]|nr:hypothetical protein BC826DRAFT_974159 [Russula brevipes]